MMRKRTIGTQIGTAKKTVAVAPKNGETSLALHNTSNI
jgi:hypothetical protein